MRIQTLRFIDMFFAKPIAIALSFFLLLLKPFRKNKPIENDKIVSILLCKFYGVGSYLYLSSTIKALSDTFPKAKIGALTLAGNTDFLQYLDLVDKFYVIDDSSLPRLVKSTLRAYLSIWKSRAQIAIDAEFFTNISLLAILFSFARYRAGFYLNNLQRSTLLTHFAHYNQHSHISRVFKDLAVVLGAPEDNCSYPNIRIPRSSREKVDGMLQELMSKGIGKIICVNVNASELSYQRRWPIDNFQILCAEVLTAMQDAFIFLIGSKEERAYTEQARDRIDESMQWRIRNIAGETLLIDLCELLRRSDLFIGNDSGPLHLAAAMGTRTISFFGPETPSLYGPMGNGHRVFHQNTYCSPCLNVFNMKTSQAGHKRCRYDDNVCLSSISPPMVIEEVLKLWDE